MHLRLDADDVHQYLPAGCSENVRYLQELKQTWAEPDVPQMWLEPVHKNEGDYDFHWFWNNSLVHMYLSHLKAVLPIVSAGSIAERSLLHCRPSFCIASERHKLHVAYGDRREIKTRMSSCQVLQFLQYRGEERQAEFAIATALDGIPGAYVRRRNLAELPHGPGSPREVSHIDCAVLLVPLGPSANTAAQLRQLPMSLVNPPLVLCAKGVSRWGDDGRPSPSLSSIIGSLATTAEISLKAITDTWARRIEQQLGRPDVAPSADNVWRGSAELPMWAMPLGIIYDSEVIHFVAHIPYKVGSTAEYKSLSLLFDTLPFPEDCRGDIFDFILGRYKVAYAMLCIQQHVLRLASIWERVHWLEKEEIPRDDDQLDPCVLPPAHGETTAEAEGDVPPCLPTESSAIAAAVADYRSTASKLFSPPPSVISSALSFDLHLLIDDSRTGPDPEMEYRDHIKATELVEDWRPRLLP